MRALPLTTAAGAHWTVRALAGAKQPDDLGTVPGEPIPAVVPGEVHTDLLAAGLIPDPFDGANEPRLFWIGRTRWEYRAVFDWEPDGHAVQELVAEGLDTVATIRLNGTVVGESANQHRSYRFDVTEALIAGSNELVIEFAAPAVQAEKRSAALGPRPASYAHKYNAIRKMASNFGWDWGPDVATVGIWKPLRIESWSGVRIASVRPLAGLDEDRGVLDTHVELAWSAGPVEATVTVELAGSTTETTVSGPVRVRSVVEEVRRWWPRGYGEQALYEVTVTVRAGSAADKWSGRVGFRTVSLDVGPDQEGTRFGLVVNGQPVYVRGANWIPDDAFVTRLNRETYRRSIQDAVDAGMNLLRVWGGGIYESDDFYDLCAEQGILVWQDFLFACAAYSEDEPLRSEVEAEARQAVTRLSQYASLAVWNGNNENIWGYVDWGWRVPLAGRSWGEGYYFDLLPRIVAELDPRTPYSPGSPYSFERYVHPNDEHHGTQHIWDVWNQVDYSRYREYRPRFVSEFGFQGPPAWSTLVSVVHDEPLDPYGAQVLVHQKAYEGNQKLERGLGEHLPKWRDIDDWHWVTQLNQARAIAFGIEHFRSLFPVNTGAIVWQLNDNWPVVSWAAVDGHGIRKPLWYALRRVYADRLITVQPRDHELVVAAHNDTDAPWTTEVHVTRRSTLVGSPVLASETFALDVVPRSAVTSSLPPSLTTPADPSTEYLEITADDARTHWYFVEDTSLRLLPPAEAYQPTITPHRTGYDLTVTATSLTKDLAYFPDRLDPAARVDSSLITLSAGDHHTFHVTGAPAPPELPGVPLLRSVNDLLV